MKDLFEANLMDFIKTVPEVGPSLRDRYNEAVRGCYSPVAARKRFAEYDAFRGIWMEEMVGWLWGKNRLGVHSLTQFAWRVQHDRLSEGGYKICCLTWSDRNQRVYLGDGLLEYLGLVKDDAEAVARRMGLL